MTDTTIPQLDDSDVVLISCETIEEAWNGEVDFLTEAIEDELSNGTLPQSAASEILAKLNNEHNDCSKPIDFHGVSRSAQYFVSRMERANKLKYAVSPYYFPPECDGDYTVARRVLNRTPADMVKNRDGKRVWMATKEDRQSIIWDRRRTKAIGITMKVVLPWLIVIAAAKWAVIPMLGAIRGKEIGYELSKLILCVVAGAFGWLLTS